MKKEAPFIVFQRDFQPAHTLLDTAFALFDGQSSVKM
jgi:hypothetical protein